MNLPPPISSRTEIERVIAAAARVVARVRVALRRLDGSRRAGALRPAHLIRSLHVVYVVYALAAHRAHVEAADRQTACRSPRTSATSSSCRFCSASDAGAVEPVLHLFRILALLRRAALGMARARCGRPAVVLLATYIADERLDGPGSRAWRIRIRSVHGPRGEPDDVFCRPARVSRPLRGAAAGRDRAARSMAGRWRAPTPTALSSNCHRARRARLSGAGHAPLAHLGRGR